MNFLEAIYLLSFIKHASFRDVPEEYLSFIKSSTDQDIQVKEMPKLEQTMNFANPWIN